MRRHVDVKYPPPIVAQNDQDKQDPEGCGRHCEEIERDDFLAVVVEKCPPGLDGGPRRLIMYLETVASDTSMPSFNSSP